MIGSCQWISSLSWYKGAILCPLFPCYCARFHKVPERSPSLHHLSWIPLGNEDIDWHRLQLTNPVNSHEPTHTSYLKAQGTTRRMGGADGHTDQVFLLWVTLQLVRKDGNEPGLRWRAWLWIYCIWSDRCPGKTTWTKKANQCPLFTAVIFREMQAHRESFAFIQNLRMQ